MPATANITPAAPTDGLAYSTSVPITPNEADLGDGLLSPHPIPTAYGEAISAVIQLSINGHIVANSTYIVLQQDMGDGVWVDMNWIVWNGSDGGATFVMSNGIAGANTFQQSRQSGAVPSPQSNGQNQMALGGRLRFVGKTTTAGGSSSLAGVPTQVTATIKYRLQPVR